METDIKKTPAKRKRSVASATKPLPEVTNEQKPVEHTEKPDKELPEVGNSENVIVIGGKPIEIKSTKMRYHRDRTALFYKALEFYSLPDILATPAGSFDEDRDGDKCLMDWLIAVTDDPELIVENYNDMDADIVEKMLLIFKRVNKIDEKEQKAKNLQMEREGAKKG